MKARFIIFLMLIPVGFSCQSQQLETVPFVDLNRYAGKWYDIAHLPARFMTGCECTTADYTITGKDYVIVVNRCRKGDPAKWRSVRGKAFVVKNSGNAKLKVQFLWPFKGDYWIIDLADDYSYAVVGNQSRKYLWILSRSPQMDQKLLDEIIRRTGNKGFAIDQLEFTRHFSCE